MTKPITLVCGFGRCGSSLTMQMLAAGGMTALGQYPSFEPLGAEATLRYSNRLPTLLLQQAEGGALKLLDPHRYLLPKRDYRVVWLSRDYREQAKSQAKFAHLMFGIPVNRRTVRGFEQSYPKDEPKARNALARAGATAFLDLRFENLIAPDNRTAVEKLSGFCGGLDIEAMLDVVVPRSPAAQPGLEIELTLHRRGRAAA